MARTAALSRILGVALIAGCGASAAEPDGGAQEDARAPGDDAAPRPDASSERDAATPDPDPRLLVLSRDGDVASVGLAAPWTVHDTAELARTVASARCRGDLCIVVHPAPIDALTVLSAHDLDARRTISLARGADPRDVAIVDDHTVVVSQRGVSSLAILDLDGDTTRAIDLAAVADDDGNPESGRLAACGRRVFAQLGRTVGDSGAPSELPGAIAVIDLDRPAGAEIVDADPGAEGAQAIPLAERAAFDMPVDCAAGRLALAEPRPLMAGGGAFEVVDLSAMSAAPLDLAAFAQVGGFEIVGPGEAWLITHSTTGPGPSSHLNFMVGETSGDTHNTFASEHVDDLAMDRELDLLFYPDPCSLDLYPGCETGVHAFVASTGARASTSPIDVGFPPIELAIAR